MKRLAIVTTHPIQYYAPLFRLLSRDDTAFSIKIFYTWSQSQEQLHDPDFGVKVQWDVPLLEGYDYTFVHNTSANPGSRSFRGIINPTLPKEIESWKADAVLVIGWAFESHLKALRYFKGKVPVLFRGDSNLVDEPTGVSLQKALRRIFLRWVYSHVDYALYVGEANKKYYTAHGLKAKQLFFSPHAIDNNRFIDKLSVTQQEARNWRAKLGIKEQEIVFLFAGKLTHKKAPDLLIKAFKNGRFPETKLIIIGNGQFENELKNSSQADPNILFLPFQNQSTMPLVYHLADVFVLPSRGPGETWGLVVNEAMVCSRAVIVSDKCGCAPDLVKPGVNGYIFKSDNEEDLQRCMKAALENYKELGANSFKIIQEYNYTKTIEQLKLIANLS